MRDRKLIVTPIKDSKLISKVLANDNARLILELVSDEPLSAAQISGKMKLSLTTIDYSLKQLESAGLIKSKTGFNKNKRIVKYYEPQNKFILIAPKVSQDILSTLKSMLPFLGLAGIVSIFLEYFIRLPVKQGIPQQPVIAPGGDAAAETIGDVTKDQIVTTLINPHYGIAFFVVSLAAIIFYILWRNRKL